LSSPAIVSANTKTKSTTKQWCNGSQGAHYNAIIKFLSVLTKHTRATCNQLVEPTKDWRSDCLAKRNLVGVELCGVLGRLHSMEGLAQSNNNAKFNYSAEHKQKLLETSAKVVGSKEYNVEGWGRDFASREGRVRARVAASVGQTCAQGKNTAQGGSHNREDTIALLPGVFFFSFVPFFDSFFIAFFFFDWRGI
jgi:hypothetical protein